MMLLLFLIGCATMQKVGISIKAPTTQMLIKNAAFLAGYTIGKDMPVIAAEIKHYSQPGKANILVLYENWKRYLAYRLKDPVHRQLAMSMLSLVDIDLQMKPPIEQEKTIRELLKDFISGLEVGMKAQST